MASKCRECNIELVDAQVSLEFRAVQTGSDEWPQFPVLAAICPKCGRMDLHLATPVQFKAWLDSQNSKARAVGA